MVTFPHSGLCVLAACFTIACAMPKGLPHNLMNDNYAILKELDIDNEKYLLEDYQLEKQKDNANITKANDSANPLFPYPLHASCRVEW